jgi:hypothetical protein
MTNIIITDIEEDVDALVAKIKGSTAATVVVQDAEAIGSATLAYIKNNGLTDLYNIALAALTGAATGTSFATVAATVVTQGEAAGITIAKGAEGIVLAQAQADLVAAGTLISPTSGTIVPTAPVPAAPAA